MTSESILLRIGREAGCVLRMVAVRGRSLVAVAVMLAAGVASAAGWESWQQPMIYGATFEDYASSQALSELGAVNGIWTGQTSEGVITAADLGRADVMCMTYETPSDTGIFFTPDSTGDRDLKSCMISLMMSGAEFLPELGDDARAALAIHAPPEGERTFVGWGWSEEEKKCRWFPLECDGASPKEDGWRDLSVRFSKGKDGNVRVQYRINIGTDKEKKYVPLVLTGSEVSWLLAGARGSGELVKKVEFRGVGSLEKLDGSEPQRGLTAGVGDWYEGLFDERVTLHGSGEWTKEPQSKGSDYIINVDPGESPNTFIPSAAQNGRFLVAKFSVQFNGCSGDDSVPEGAISRIRIVDAGDAGGYRFVCLANGLWVTNQTVAADISSKYTVEVGLDRVERTMSYSVKEGYGAEGGTNIVLCVGKVPDGVPCAFNAIDFEGSGRLREIKGIDKSNAVR